MTASSIDVIRDRVSSATEESPIAVFKDVRGEYVHLNAVFASTVLTQNAIRNDDPALIGVYHKKSNSALMVADLKAAEIKKPKA